jgi:hypothetical protein
VGGYWHRVEDVGRSVNVSSISAMFCRLDNMRMIQTIKKSPIHAPAVKL